MKFSFFTSLICLFLFTGTSYAQWEAMSSLPPNAAERNHPITFALDGKGYLLTGFKDDLKGMSDFYQYDPNSDTWSPLPDFPGGDRGFAYGVTTRGKAYVGFGRTTSFGSTVVLDDLWEFNPADTSWKELASCPCQPRFHPAMVATSDKIYVGLGGSTIGDLDDWWEYDIDTDSWTRKEDLPGDERHHPYYFAIDDYPYAGFGHHSQNIYKDMYRFDPANNTWTPIQDLPAQGRVAGTQFSFAGKGYLLSGQGDTHQNLPTGEFWEYDPATDSWTSLPPHPGTGRWAPGSFVIDNKVYFMTGRLSDDTKDMWSFDLSPLISSNDDPYFDALEVGPNPSNGIINIYFENPIDRVEIFDAMGRSQQVLRSVSNSINLEFLAEGIYTLQFISENKKANRKIVITK